MKPYTVLYRIETILAPADPPFGFLCQAEDSDHAEEQCVNAYPDSDVVWVVEDSSYQTALDNYWHTGETT